MSEQRRRPGRPRTYTVRVYTYLDESLKARLAAHADATGDSEAEIVRQAIEDKLARKGNRG